MVCTAHVLVRGFRTPEVATVSQKQFMGSVRTQVMGTGRVKCGKHLPPALGPSSA